MISGGSSAIGLYWLICEILYFILKKWFLWYFKIVLSSIFFINYEKFTNISKFLNFENNESCHFLKLSYRENIF